MQESSTKLFITGGQLGFQQGNSNTDGIVWKNNGYTVTFPNNVTQGFQITIVNSGIGTITLDASNLLTTDTFVKLEDQYAGASAVHKSNGTWFSWGNLKQKLIFLNK